MLDPLRVNVAAYIPLDNPYSYQGTDGPWDDQELQRAFARASVIEVAAIDNRRNSSSFALSLSGTSSPLTGSPSVFPENLSAIGEFWTLKVAKAGLLNRKDDTIEGGKKASGRKWKPWGAILTGSQLLLFRDPTWVTNLLAQPERQDGQVIFPEVSVLKPEELLSVRDAVAVFDSSYTKVCNGYTT